jgi:hypothetical protein
MRHEDFIQDLHYIDRMLLLLVYSDTPILSKGIICMQLKCTMNKVLSNSIQQQRPRFLEGFICGHLLSFITIYLLKSPSSVCKAHFIITQSTNSTKYLRYKIKKRGSIRLLLLLLLLSFILLSLPSAAVHFCFRVGGGAPEDRGKSHPSWPSEEMCKKTGALPLGCHAMLYVSISFCFCLFRMQKDRTEQRGRGSELNC